MERDWRRGTITELSSTVEPTARVIHRLRHHRRCPESGSTVGLLSMNVSRVGKGTSKTQF